MQETITNIDKQAIKTLLLRERGRFRKVAKRSGVAASSLTRWLNGDFPSSKMERRVPKALRKLGYINDHGEAA